MAQQERRRWMACGERMCARPTKSRPCSGCTRWVGGRGGSRPSSAAAGTAMWSAAAGPLAVASRPHPRRVGELAPSASVPSGQRRRGAPGTPGRARHQHLRTVERAVAHLRRSWPPRPVPRCGSRRRPAGRCRSTGGVSVVIGAKPSGSSCSSRPGHSRRIFVQRSGTSGKRRGSTGSRAPSATSAGCRDPARRPRAGRAPRRADAWCSTNGCMLSPATGACGRRPAHLPSADQGQGRARGRLRQAQRHRRAELRELGGARGASRLVDARGGRPAHPRHDRRAADHALRARRRPCGRSTAGRRSGRGASSPAGCIRTAPSRSTPTPTACPGG